MFESNAKTIMLHCVFNAIYINNQCFTNKILHKLFDISFNFQKNKIFFRETHNTNKQTNKQSISQKWELKFKCLQPRHLYWKDDSFVKDIIDMCVNRCYNVNMLISLDRLWDSLPCSFWMIRCECRLVPCTFTV